MTLKRYVEKLISNCIFIAGFIWVIGHQMIGLVSPEPGVWVSKIISFFVGLAFLLKAIIEGHEAKRMGWITIGWLLVFAAIFLKLNIWVLGIVLVGGFFVLKAAKDYSKYTVETYHKIKKELKE